MTARTDDERREVARRLRECRGGWSSGECYYTIIHALGLPDTSREDGGAALYARLADLMEPGCDRGPSGWTSFDERLPEPGAPVLCKGKNGAYYVGKPVTFRGERTGKVWVPCGAEYRSPAAWRPVDSPPCDREALLALADEMDDLAEAWGGKYPTNRVAAYARSIREALGVES